MRHSSARRRSARRSTIAVAATAVAALAASGCGGGGSSGGDGDFQSPAPFPVALSATGPDQLQSATAGPAGSFYAAGFAADGPDATDARNVTVVKLNSSGAPDTAFGGGDGIATIPVESAGGNDQIDIATQDDKILVLFTVANEDDPDDRDLAILRLNADGTLDSTFAPTSTSTPDGLQVIDLSTASNGEGEDGSRALAVDPTNDLIYIHALQRGEGTAAAGGDRTDTDFAVVRLTAAGELDTSFGGGDGKHLLDIDDDERNATPRGISVLPDGSVIACGYADNPNEGDTPQVVLYKLTDAGALDPAFATGGVFHEPVLTVQTEAYNFAVHGPNLVTAGYGRESGSINEWVSLRFNATTGVRDVAWGGAPDGAVLVQPSVNSSNCRNAVALPGDKTLLLGSTGSGFPGRDAAYAVLSADGVLDPAYGGTAHVFPLGVDGDDQLWGGAVSGNNVLLVGYSRADGGVQTAGANDDSWALLIPLQ